MSLGRKIILNTAAQTAGQGLSYLLGMATAMLTMRYLKPEGFGTYNLVLVYVGIIGGFAELGGQIVLVREVNQRPANAPSIIGNFLLLKLALTAAVFALGISLLWLLDYSGGLRFLLALGLTAMLLSFPAAAGAVFQARLKIWYAVVINLAAKAIGLLAVLAMIGLRQGIVLLLWGNILIAALSSGVYLWLVIRQERPSFRPDPGLMLRLLRESVPVGGLLIIGGLMFKVDQILLSRLALARDLGLYGAAYKFVDWGLLGASGLLVSHLPIFSQYINSERDRVTQLYQRSFDLIVLLLLPMAITVSLMALPMVRLVCGPEYAPAAGALAVLIWVVLLNTINTMAVNILIALKAQVPLFLVYAAVVLVNIGINVYGIPRYGFIACAWASVLNEVLGMAGTLVLVRRQFGFSPSFGSVAREAAIGLAAAVPVLGLARPRSLAAGLAVYLAGWIALQLVFGKLIAEIKWLQGRIAR